MNKRSVALLGSALMIAGVAAGASPALAQDRGDRDSRPGECSVSLDQNRRTLEIDIDASRRADNALVRVNFDGRRGDTLRRVSLDRRGDGSATVSIPRRADSVDVTVYVRDGRRGGFITCTDSLDLGRGGRNF